MATIINNPGAGDSSDSGGMASILMAVVLVLVLGGLFFVYALPAMQNNGTGAPTSDTLDVNVQLPADLTPAVPAPVAPAPAPAAPAPTPAP